jgi:hypothetical protein
MDEKQQDANDTSVWCVDSESGEHYLLDRTTGFIIAKKGADGNIIYSK